MHCRMFCNTPASPYSMPVAALLLSTTKSVSKHVGSLLGAISSRLRTTVLLFPEPAGLSESKCGYSSLLSPRYFPKKMGCL